MSVTARLKRPPEAAAPSVLRLLAWKRVLLVAGICALPVLLYAPFFNEPFMRDEGYYAAASQAMLHGAIPYTDFFDNKPPLIYVFYAASFLMFGETLWAPRLLVSLMISLAALCVYFNARLLFSSHKTGVIAAATFATSIGLAKLETNANTEFFMLLPMTAGLLAFTQARRTGSRWWYLAAGALGGAAILTKTIYVIPMAFLFLFAVVQKWRCSPDGASLLSPVVWLGPSLMIAGSLAVFAVFAVPLALMGAFGDMVEGLTYYSWIYSGHVSLSARLIATVKSPAFLVFVTGPWVVLAAFGAFVLLRAKDKDTGLLLAGWFAANLASIYAVGRFYNHYYIVLLPAMALLVPAGIDLLLKNWRTIPGQAFIAVAMPVLLMAPLALTIHIYAQPTPSDRHIAKYGGDRTDWEAQSPALGEWLKEHTNPGDYIYNFGFQSELYFYADRTSPSRFFFDNALGLDEKYERQAVEQLSESPPAYVIDSAIYERKTELNYYSEPVHQWVEQNYDYVGKIHYADIWRLKGYEQ